MSKKGTRRRGMVGGLAMALGSMLAGGDSVLMDYPELQKPTKTRKPRRTLIGPKHVHNYRADQRAKAKRKGRKTNKQRHRATIWLLAIILLPACEGATADKMPMFDEQTNTSAIIIKTDEHGCWWAQDRFAAYGRDIEHHPKCPNHEDTRN